VRAGDWEVCVDVDALIEEAVAARSRAYAPYSGFRMGAAVLTDGGTIVTGALVENVSLGLAMCAERVALFSCIDTGVRPVALAVVSPRTDGTVTFPCGACLQVALELGGANLEVLAVTPDRDVERATLRDLLPRGPKKD
jgi:cytidine deaminase